MRDKQVHAPYNFVSFPNKVIRRYARLEDVPRQDRWDEDLLSGEITVTMTAQTPVFVSDGARDSRGRNDGHFLRDAEGRCIIPGSSLRGLVRENMQILGCGLTRPGEDFQDVNLYYRALADARGALKSGLKGQYRNMLGIHNNSQPTEIRTGYLHCDPAAGGSGYYIVPTLPHPTSDHAVCRLRRDDPRVAELVRNMPRPGVLEGICYWGEEAAGRREGTPVQGGRVGIALGDPEQHPGALAGRLVSPGYMQKQNRVYLFPEEDPAAGRIVLSQESVLVYQEDYEARLNSLGGTAGLPPKGEKGAREAEIKRRKAFWALPKAGECKPVFYLEGDVVSFSPSSYYLRVAYRHKLSHGIPRSHQTRNQEELFLDYPYAVLGFTQGKAALRSRVSFGDLGLEGAPSYAPEATVVLGEPKLSFFGAYTKEGMDYNQEQFQFRGYKQYWLHDITSQPPGDNTQVGTTLRPLAAGSRFTGTIRYRNLHPDELGLLLWCLGLEEGCYQPMGMGKPLGYGRMTLAIDALRPFRPRDLYPSLIPDGAFFTAPAQPAGRVAELIQSYQAWLGDKQAQEALKNQTVPDIRALPHIREFFTIRSLICQRPEPVSYMALEEYKNVMRSLAPISEVAGQAADAPPAAQAPGSAAEGDSTLLQGKVTQVSNGKCTVVAGGTLMQAFYLQAAGPKKGGKKRDGAGPQPPVKGQTVTLRFDGKRWIVVQDQ